MDLSKEIIQFFDDGSRFMPLGIKISHQGQDICNVKKVAKG